MVIDRYKGERIIIGKSVTVIILGIGKNEISLGIEAPKSVKVLRSELKKYPTEDKDNALDKKL